MPGLCETKRVMVMEGVDMTGPGRIPPGVDQSRPAPARIYDYLLAGSHNFQVDREAAQRIMTVVPEIRDCAWSNRGFHQRAAIWITKRGVRQFIDIGSGLPTADNTHEVVGRTAPGCRVVYVDNDPMVRAQASELLAGVESARAVLGDLREPEAILGNPEVREFLDFSQPVGVLMTAVLHFVADSSDPWGKVRAFAGPLAPGSYLALSHLTSDHKPERSVAAFCGVFENATEQMHFRGREEIQRLFEGLELQPPYDWETEGRLCYTGDWGAEDPLLADSDGSRWLYCGVARRA